MSFACLVLWAENSFGQKELPKNHSESIKTESKQLESKSVESSNQQEATKLEKSTVSFQQRVKEKESAVKEKSEN